MPSNFPSKIKYGRQASMSMNSQITIPSCDHDFSIYYDHWYSPHLPVSEMISTADEQYFNERMNPGGGTLGISGWGCAARTLEPLAYTRASFSWILLPYTRVNSPNHRFPSEFRFLTVNDIQ